MAFDAFFLTAVLSEIREKTAGARVEKIHQPSRDTLILHLKGQEGRHKLLFAANPAAPRLHLTTSNPENPPEPPMFCMLLRKHLSGARLVDIQQIPMERWAGFTFDCIDEMGDPVQKKLVCELMGRDTGEEPVLLLDDVLSELDPGRQDFVLNQIVSGQVFITCCEPGRFTKLGKTIEIMKGNLV